MYLVSYRLIVGSSQHYAPSAEAALELIRHIRAGGGEITGIEDRQRKALSISDIEFLVTLERK